MIRRIQSLIMGLTALLVTLLLGLAPVQANTALGAYQADHQIAPGDQHAIHLTTLGNFDYHAKIASECCNDTNRTGPRINVADEFEHTSTNGYHTYDYGDLDTGHGLGISVDPDGRLGFEISALGDSTTLGSGRDMFNSAMIRMRADGVEVTEIQGNWIGQSGSVNHQQYVEGIGQGLSPQQAATNTWTGQVAADYGYTNVEVVLDSINNVIVRFGLPE